MALCRPSSSRILQLIIALEVVVDLPWAMPLALKPEPVQAPCLSLSYYAVIVT
jgi:hypothetical protein